MGAGWFVAAVLYVLAAVLCLVVPAAKRSHGVVKLAICLMWPVAVLIGLVASPARCCSGRSSADDRELSRA